jgi:hypothetical protein
LAIIHAAFMGRLLLDRKFYEHTLDKNKLQTPTHAYFNFFPLCIKHSS